jgi:hypothetical protein
MDSPSMLPKEISSEEHESFLRSLLAMFGRDANDSFGYEGKEGEMRRPTGMRHWTQSFGGFRR